MSVVGSINSGGSARGQAQKENEQGRQAAQGRAQSLEEKGRETRDPAQIGQGHLEPGRQYRDLRDARGRRARKRGRANAARRGAQGGRGGGQGATGGARGGVVRAQASELRRIARARG